MEPKKKPETIARATAGMKFKAFTKREDRIRQPPTQPHRTLMLFDAQSDAPAPCSLPEILCLWAGEPRDLVRRNIKHLARRIRRGDWASPQSTRLVPLASAGQDSTSKCSVSRGSLSFTGSPIRRDLCQRSAYFLGFGSSRRRK